MSRILEQTISKRLVLGKSILAEAQLREKVEIMIQNRSIMILPIEQMRFAKNLNSSF